MTSTIRPYTGLKEGYAGGRRPGLELLANGIQYLTAGRIWNNGTYGLRPNKSNATIPSVHCTGRAADLSRRQYNGHAGSGRDFMLVLIDALTANADEIGLELVIDYEHAPHGRIWSCTRNAWEDCAPGYIAGAGGDWIHIEIDPVHANDAKLIEKAWPALVGATTPKKAPAKKKV